MCDLLFVLRQASTYLPPLNPDLVQSLAHYVEGSLADFFSQPTKVSLDARLTVFNVSALGEELWPIGLRLIEQFVWTQVRWHFVQGARRAQLVVDELWWTLRSTEGGVFLETVARKDPKYWLGLAVASQEPADCLNSPHGLAIVHNSSTHVLLAMDRGALRVGTGTFDLTPNEVALLEGAVPGQALVLCAGERMFLDVVASSAERELFDTRPAEEAERNRQRRRGVALPPGASLAPAERDRPAAEASPDGRRSADAPKRSWQLFDDRTRSRAAHFPSYLETTPMTVSTASEHAHFFVAGQDVPWFGSHELASEPARPSIRRYALASSHRGDAGVRQ